jgi:hypothetical protein
MNRSIKRITSLGIFIAAIMLGNAAQADGVGTAGVWEVHITPDGAPGPVAVNIVHYDQDGTLTNIDAQFGTGLGTWELAAGGRFTSDFTHLFDADGIPGMVVVQGSGELGKDKDTATGEFTTTIYVGGVQVDQFSGTIESFRK